MCNQACVDFGKRSLKEEDVKGKSVIEVGSCDFNGSLRSAVEALHPALYIGVDIKPGKGVDRVCKAEDLIRQFGRDKFDILISTELLEHIGNWKKAISNFKNVMKPGGTMVVTTRSKGFGYHGFPFDFWRYEISDMERILSDFVIEVAEKDSEMRGIFIKARKPRDFTENSLAAYRLYSVEFGRRSTVTESSLYFPIFFIVRLITKEWPELVKQTAAYKRFKLWEKARFQKI